MSSLRPLRSLSILPPHPIPFHPIPSHPRRARARARRRGTTSLAARRLSAHTRSSQFLRLRLRLPWPLPLRRSAHDKQVHDVASVAQTQCAQCVRLLTAAITPSPSDPTPSPTIAGLTWCPFFLPATDVPTRIALSRQEYSYRSYHPACARCTAPAGFVSAPPSPLVTAQLRQECSSPSIFERARLCVASPFRLYLATRSNIAKHTKHRCRSTSVASRHPAPRQRFLLLGSASQQLTGPAPSRRPSPLP